jgi:hypothetical protein
MKRLSVCAFARSLRYSAATAFAGEDKTPRAIWVASELIKSELEAVLNT